MKHNVLDFLTALGENNNREWFHANKHLYDAAKTEVEQFVNSIIPIIGAFDDAIKLVEAKDCMFRIFRDVRFAKDKSPYKVNMGAWITPLGRKSPGPGYYIHIQPGSSFVAVGVYMPEPEQLKRIRKEIFYNAEEFLSILNDKQFKKYFKGIDDWDKAKMAPKDFPKDFIHIDLLKNRHYTVSCPLKDEEVVKEDFQKTAGGVFKAAYQLNQFLRRGLEG
jgi:uncharacterized protein (TIGR02453 family)